MKLTLTESKYLTDSISIISELVNEGTLKVQKDKINLIAMDPANVAMVSFTLLSSAFADYELPKEQKLSLNLESFRQVLKRAKPTDTIILSLDEEKNRLKIKLVGSSTRTFNLSLLRLDEKEQRIPDLKFPTKITIPTTDLNEAVEDMGIIADSVALTAEKEKFIINSESHLHSAKAEFPAEGSISIELTSGPVTSKYSIEYLKKIMKASKLTNNLTLQFSKDYPLKLDYSVKDRMKLEFILAPRVSD